MVSRRVNGKFRSHGPEKVGAIFLSRLGFPDKVCKLVAAHIVTERYLITKNPKYYNNLSASKQTFEYQGGRLDHRQLKAFENDDLFLFHLKKLENGMIRQRKLIKNF